jgi:hypothetical protein
MSLLLAATDTGDEPVTVEEFENLFWLFAVAGNETLRNGTPGGMIALLEHPAAMSRLRADPTLVPGAVEEMLRWWTPVMTFRRTAAVEVTLAGVDIAAGDKVVVSFSSANRDEGSSPTPTGSTSSSGPTRTCPYATGRTSDSARTLRGYRCVRCSRTGSPRLDELSYAGEPDYLQSELPARRQAAAVRWRPLTQPLTPP